MTQTASRRRLVACVLGVAFISMCAVTRIEAHPLAPALLEMKEDTAGQVEVLWKRSSLSVPGSNIAPVVPEACTIVSPPKSERQGVAVLLRWVIDCGNQGLVGRPVRVDGLGPAKIDTLVRIQLADGRMIQRVLRRSEPSMIVPSKPDRLAVFQDYLVIGFEHILSGVDHLLFVFGLFMLCADRRILIKTITAFTLGHSVTLSLAALGITKVPTGPIEVLIAASVLVLAVELARDANEPTWMRRFPWPMALVFGLLHGMGFAGALREVGLPGGEIPMALLSFNLGIELGQIVFVVAVSALAFLLARATQGRPSPLPAEIPRRAAIYLMGSMAAYWVIDRSVNLL